MLGGNRNGLAVADDPIEGQIVFVTCEFGVIVAPHGGSNAFQPFTIPHPFGPSADAWEEGPPVAGPDPTGRVVLLVRAAVDRGHAFHVTRKNAAGDNWEQWRTLPVVPDANAVTGEAFLSAVRNDIEAYCTAGGAIYYISASTRMTVRPSHDGTRLTSNTSVMRMPSQR